MAEIVATFDTVEKTFKVTMDGKDMGDVDSFNVYEKKYDEKGNYVEDSEEFVCSIVMCDCDEEEGMTTHTHVHASELQNVEIKYTKRVVSDILSCFGKN